MPFGISPEVMGALIILVFGMVMGMSVPFRYGVERIQGTGRWAMSKLPYEPPPGKSEEKALEDAVEEESQ